MNISTLEQARKQQVELLSSLSKLQIGDVVIKSRLDEATAYTLLEVIAHDELVFFTVLDSTDRYYKPCIGKMTQEMRLGNITDEYYDDITSGFTRNATGVEVPNKYNIKKLTFEEFVDRSAVYFKVLDK